MTLYMLDTDEAVDATFGNHSLKVSRAPRAVSGTKPDLTLRSTAQLILVMGGGWGVGDGGWGVGGGCLLAFRVLRVLNCFWWGGGGRVPSCC